MARPTHSPRRTVFHGRSIVANSIPGAALKTDSVGLTALSDAMQRNVNVVALGNTTATAFNSVIFRAPASGAKIAACYICPGSAQNHAVNESDTWIFVVKKYSGAAALSKNAPSLSNQTLAATAFKTIPCNGGNSTLTSGQRLRVEASISGSPAALQWPVAVIEWTPLTNA